MYTILCSNTHYKPNQIICGLGQTVIVTGWMVKGIVAKKLEPHSYAAIGQLYSPTRGINFLLPSTIINHPQSIKDAIAALKSTTYWTFDGQPKIEPKHLL